MQSESFWREWLLLTKAPTRAAAPNRAREIGPSPRRRIETLVQVCPDSCRATQSACQEAIISTQPRGGGGVQAAAVHLLQVSSPP